MAARPIFCRGNPPRLVGRRNEKRRPHESCFNFGSVRYSSPPLLLALVSLLNSYQNTITVDGQRSGQNNWLDPSHHTEEPRRRVYQRQADARHADFESYSFHPSRRKHRFSLLALRFPTSIFALLSLDVTYDKVDDKGLHITVKGQPRVLEVDTIIECAGQLPA